MNQYNNEKVNYDSKSDALYLGLKNGIEEEFVEVAPGVNVELDEQGKVLGVEILNASRVLRSVLAGMRGRALANV